MRTVVAILLLLLVTGYAACHLPVNADTGAATKDRAADSWRRTATGWERTNWQPARRDLDAYCSLPHPGVLALGEALLSLTAMLAFVKSTKSADNPARYTIVTRKISDRVVFPASETL